MLKILSLGAGVQSSTILLMSCRGDLPKIDHAIFADTQWEPKAVYNHLKYLEVEAELAGIPVHRVTAGDLRADALNFGTERSRWASMPLYIRNPNGSVGAVTRQCTKEYKIEPIEKFIRRELLGLKPRQIAPALAVQHWFGISADEVYRNRKSLKHWQTFHYPLQVDVTSPRKDSLYGRGFDRQDCLNWINEKGYPEPPRSACIGCPFHSDDEWHRLKMTDPDGWADAVAFDLEIRSKGENETPRSFNKRFVGLPFLHRSCVPLSEVVLKVKEKQFGMAEECSGHCGV